MRYREIEPTLGISGTSIDSILYETTAHVNTNFSHTKHVYYIVTGDESWNYVHEPEIKQQHTKHFHAKRKNWICTTYNN